MAQRRRMPSKSATVVRSGAAPFAGSPFMWSMPTEKPAARRREAPRGRDEKEGTFFFRRAEGTRLCR